MHFGLGTGDIAIGVVDHDITAGFFNCQQHSVPMPYGNPECHDAKQQKYKDWYYQTGLDDSRSIFRTYYRAAPTCRNHYSRHCVRTELVAVIEEGKAKLVQDSIGEKFSVAEIVTVTSTRGSANPVHGLESVGEGQVTLVLSLQEQDEEALGVTGEHVPLESVRPKKLQTC